MQRSIPWFAALLATFKTLLIALVYEVFFDGQTESRYGL